MKKIKLANIHPETVADEIGSFIVEQITNSGRTGGVIGLSGGVDSTTTAALAKRAFDHYNLANKNSDKNKLELVGYLLPSLTNSPKDAEDGENIAKRLGINYEIIDIEPVVQAFRLTNPKTLESKLHKGNLMAEIRAVILHAKAATENKLLIGTGNRDEDFGVGYYTLYGDGAVHLSPVGNLPKRLVREMARYLGFKDLADRVPTAGLEPGQTDFKDLGYEYETVELVSEGIMQSLSFAELIENKKIEEYVSKDIEKYSKLFGKSKFQNAEEIVRDILYRNEIASAKSRIVHPPTAKITLIYEEEK